MKVLRRSWSRAIPVLALLLSAGLCGPGFAQAPAFPAPLISVAEARAIIEGAVAAARERNLRLGVVVVDPAGEMVAAERMDGAPGRNIQFAEGKAFASVTCRRYRQFRLRARPPSARGVSGCSNRSGRPEECA